MSDRYQSLIHTPIGQLLAKNLGLPNPVTLERYTEGDPLVDGTVAVGGDGRLGKAVVGALGRRSASPRCEDATGAAEQRYKGLVFDATGITSSDRAGRAAGVLHPAAAQPRDAARASSCSARPRSPRTPPSERVAQRALEGFTRSLGKEIGRGGTVQLVYVAPGRRRRARLDAGVPALPQVGLRVRPGRPDRRARRRPTRRRGGRRLDPPLAGKVALVTGASRGIGEQIARVLHRDGATILGVDVPQAASELQAVTAELGRRPPHPRHHRQGRPAADRPAREGEATAASTSWCTTPASPATSGSRT